jgi:hypothetical protein
MLRRDAGATGGDGHDLDPGLLRADLPQACIAMQE